MAADQALRIAALHAALLASDSATVVLERFFQPPVSIRRLRGEPVPPRPEQRLRLELELDSPWLHRRVALVSHGLVLSQADLWYVPDRLPPDMARTLLETDIPFGHVVRLLQPRRLTLEARLLEPGAAVAIEHRALLIAGDRPIAEVHERYAAGALGS